MDINIENKKLCSAVKASELAQVIVDVVDSGWYPGIFKGRGEVIEFLGPSSSGSTGSMGGPKTYDYTDYGGHGSAVCSIICSMAPNAYIHSYCALPYEKDGKQSVAVYVLEAIKDILKRVKEDKKRHVVNMSFSGSGPLDGAFADELHKLIDELVSLEVPVFVAAGNDGGERLDKYPACFWSPVCIVALNPDGTNAKFSNWMDQADFAEVGVDIPAYDHHGNKTFFMGTSGACPVAAAKAAIFIGKKPTISEADLFEALKKNAMDLGANGFDERNGWGWIASLNMSEPVENEASEVGGTMLTSKELVSYFGDAVEEGWGYVWGLNGELYSRSLAEKYHAEKKSTSEYRDPATYWLVDCAKWIGKMAADCSGGIVGAIRTVDQKYIDRSANLFYAQCVKRGPIATIPEIPGLCVWRDGHIGVYEGSGNVLEFRGTGYGAVRTKLKDRDFTNWGQLRDIQYESEEETVMAKVIKITTPVVYDSDVQLLQNALNKLGYDCGIADGKVGAKTMAGIAAFCTAHGYSGQTTPVVIPVPEMTIQVGDKKYKIELKAT